jgi:hypothetical protein
MLTTREQLGQRPIQPSGPVDLSDEAEAHLASPELDEWLRIFGETPPAPAGPRKSPGRPSELPASCDFENPFPPGYAEDLLRSQDP